MEETVGTISRSVFCHLNFILTGVVLGLGSVVFSGRGGEQRAPSSAISRCRAGGPAQPSAVLPAGGSSGAESWPGGHLLKRKLQSSVLLFFAS